MAPVPARHRTGEPLLSSPSRGLLVAGAGALALSLTGYFVYMATHPYHWTLYPVDLRVYWEGGRVVRDVGSLYDPHHAAPLYHWPGGSFQFTYPPFAALVFAPMSLIPWGLLPHLSVAANIVLLAAALWFTFRGLGYRRGLVALGPALLAAAAVFWTEPVIRTLYLGQVNLALMALILWDLTQPDTPASRWWKGAGVGIAAGIKLVPLIFIPYLVLTRRFRQAVLACAAFTATLVAGFVVLPGDSRVWWLDGLFFRGGRTGFVGWVGNQSLRGIITRFAGSVAAGKPVWLLAAAVTGLVGLTCAAVLHRAGHTMAGLLTCALTGLLVSPISWDHHWVWVAPGVAVAGHYAVRAARGLDPRYPPPGGRGAALAAPPRPARWRAAGYAALAAGSCALYGAWPGSLWGEPRDLGPFSLGLIWAPPSTSPQTYYRLGDRPWYAEYHWHGLQLLTGNSFLLGGIVIMVFLVVAAARTRRAAACPAALTPGCAARQEPGRTPGTAAARSR